MALPKKKDGFMASVNDFFKKVNKNDTVKIGSNSIQTYNSPQSPEELDKRRDMQVFRQFLQSKNWNVKHIELFDEYRRMDVTYPIINAALRLYSQEVCFFIYDTYLMLCDGSSKSLAELIHDDARDFWVWSYDEDQKKIVPVKVDKAISKGFKNVIDVQLDDDTIIKCTPNHEFLLRSGEWKEAKDLVPGDSLQSIYERYDDKGYLEFSDGSVTARNHSVKSITNNGEVVEVGDLVNAGHTHNYAIKCKTGMTIVHNCVSGDTVIGTVGGDFKVSDLYAQGKRDFYVKSYDEKWNRVEWNWVKSIKNNGVRPVLDIVVNKNVDPDNHEWDRKGTASIRCTDNHKILVDPKETDPSKKFKEAGELRVGDTIWSMYYWKDPECSCMKPVFNRTVIESITEAGEEEVFDLVDVSPNHHFLAKLTDSFYITVHNCTKDADGNVIEIISENKRVKQLLEDCFFKNLKLNSTSYLHVKSMLKFGNHFSFLNTRKGVGVIDMITLPPEAIRIQLTQNSNNLDDFKYHWMGAGTGIPFEPWEVVHWKNIEDIETEPYGQSILRSIVDTYRRIILMREAMIVYRITRAPQRLLFKIDTTGLDADGALQVSENLKKQMYKKPLVNAVTGEMDFKYNPIAIEENLYMPSYEGDTSDVKVLEGANNLDAVEDYKIIKDDLFAGLLIPKSYLTFEEDLCGSKRTCVRVLDGGNKTLGELAEDHENGVQNYIYSCDEKGNIKPGKITWAGKTKTVQSYYKITLDNEETVEFTGNHPFMMRDGSYRRADELKEGDSLMPLYTRISKKNNTDSLDGYEMVKHNEIRKNGKPKWEYTHRMVGLHEEPDGYKQNGDGHKVIHHKDGNKLNNRPDNLQFMNQIEHINEHAALAYKNLCSPESRAKLYEIQQTPEYKAKLSNSLKKDFETNDAKRKAIGEANRKYNKAENAQKIYLSKLASGELSQAGENNGNYRGLPTKEELEIALDNKKFSLLAELLKYLRDALPHRATTLKINQISDIINISEDEFYDKYICYINRKLDFDELNKLIYDGVKNNEIYSSLGITRGAINKACKNKGFENLTKYRESLEIAPYNHKVLRVELVEEECDMYDITVEGYHNFALAAGVFVHNCVRRDTRVLTSEGSMTMADLSVLMSSFPEKKFYALSCNKYGIITTGRILWCGQTKEVDEMYRVWINGNTSVDVTDNHPFMMEDLAYKRADALVVGDRVNNMKGNDSVVTKVEIVGLEASEFVYDLEVEEFHNFALESGIFIHNSNKAALAQEDLRFAGAIKQYQAHYIEGLLHIGLVHLHINGCSKEELESFEIRMNTNSTLAEKTRNEILQQRFDLAGKAWDSTNDGLNFMSFTQAAKDILHFTNEEIEKSFEDQMIEKKMVWRLKQLTEDGTYQEPNLDSQKMLGMDKENNIFSNIIFEKDSKNQKVKDIITERFSKELAKLLQEPRAKPNQKMIEDIMSQDYTVVNRFSKVKRNLDKTEKDIF